MGKTSFFKTKEGALSIAFVVIITAFVVEVIGLTIKIKGLYYAGFFAILAAIMYSPFGVYILKRK